MRSDGRVGRRRWQARSAGAQRPLSLSAAACRAGLPALRGGMAGLGELLAPSAAQSPPTTLAEYSSGAALGAVRGQPWAPPPTEPWWWPWAPSCPFSYPLDCWPLHFTLTRLLHAWILCPHSTFTLPRPSVKTVISVPNFLPTSHLREALKIWRATMLK